LWRYFPRKGVIAKIFVESLFNASLQPLSRGEGLKTPDNCKLGCNQNAIAALLE
jgi:hypothetical protein